MAEIKNAKKFPEMWYCRHMIPGVAAYENENLWVDADAMKKAIPSFEGKPVYVLHQKVDLENIHEADGYVVECFYNELDGWLWAKFLVTSDKGHQAIMSKWSVSNAYNPKAWDGAGEHLGIDYNRKISDYEFTHLAIVPNPRYEEAKIFSPDEFKAYQAKKRAELEELQNSKPTEEEPAMKFFRNKQEEIKAGDTILDTDFTEITNDDGTKHIVTIAELKKAKLEEKLLEKQNAKKNEKMVDDDEEIDVDGEMVNMADLKKCYANSMKTKKNSDKEKEEKEAKEKEAKENSDKEEKEKKDKEEKENAKRLEEISNAHKKKPAAAPVETMVSGVARGKNRYTFDGK